MPLQARPVVERKIDDDQTRRRQLLGKLLARRGIAGHDQLRRDVVQTRIVADDEQAMGAARCADGKYEQSAEPRNAWQQRQYCTARAWAAAARRHAGHRGFAGG